VKIVNQLGVPRSWGAPKNPNAVNAWRLREPQPFGANGEVGEFVMRLPDCRSLLQRRF